jgi:hypothetical protein
MRWGSRRQNLVQDSAELLGGPLARNLRTSKPTVTKRCSESRKYDPGKTPGIPHPHRDDWYLSPTQLEIDQTLQIMAVPQQCRDLEKICSMSSGLRSQLF